MWVRSRAGATGWPAWSHMSPLSHLPFGLFSACIILLKTGSCCGAARVYMCLCAHIPCCVYTCVHVPPHVCVCTYTHVLSYHIPLHAVGPLLLGVPAETSNLPPSSSVFAACSLNPNDLLARDPAMGSASQDGRLPPSPYTPRETGCKDLSLFPCC